MRHKASSRLTAALLAALLILLTACASPQEKSARFIGRGKDLFDKADYDKARIEIQNALQIDPKSAEGYYWLAMVRLRQKNIGDAFALLRKAEELAPDHRRARLELAKILVATGATDEADRKIDTLLEQDPKDVDARLVKAAILLHGDRTDEALSLLKALQADKVGKQDLYILLAAAYGKRMDQAGQEAALLEGVERATEKEALSLLLVNQYEGANQIPRAIAVLERHIAQTPKAGALRFRLADLLWKNAEPDKARRIIDQVIANADQEDDEIYQQAALFLDSHGDKEASRRLVEDGMRRLPASFKPRLQLAEFMLADGKRDETIALLSEGITRGKDPAAPGVLQSRNLLASIRLNAGESVAAAAELDAVLKESPKNIDANFLMGKLQLARGDNAKAVTALRTVVAERPDFLDGHLELATAHLNNKEFGQATQVLDQALQFFPNDPLILRKIAAVHIAAGDVEAAKRTIKRIADLAPDDLMARDLLGRLAIQDKDPQKASAIFQDIIHREPDSALGYIRLSQVHLYQGNEDKAEQVLRQGLSKLPDSVELFEALSRLSIQLGRLESASALCRSRLAKLPDDPMARNLAGVIALQRKDFDEAAANFQKASAKIPTWQEPLVNAALAHLARGQKELALTALQRSMEIDPADQPTLKAISTLLLADHQTEQAITAFEKALAKNPKLWEAANNLAYLLVERNHGQEDLDRALALSRQALAQQGDNPAVNDTLGWVLYKRGDYAQAVDSLEKARKASRQSSAMLLYHLGMALHKSGRTAEAKSVLEHALKGNEFFPGRKEAEAIVSSPS